MNLTSLHEYKWFCKIRTCLKHFAMGKHKHERKHKDKKKHKRSSSSRSASESEDEWVEKAPPTSNKTSEKTEKRDDWMSLPSSSFLSESHLERREKREEQKRRERERDQYNPRENVRELNPYWKSGGDGLPSFKKPTEDSATVYKSRNRPQTTSNWKKKTEQTVQKEKPSTVTEEPETPLSNKEMNVLASRIVKAEIMGNTKLAAELKLKLEKARKANTDLSNKEETVLLTETDSQGRVRPLRRANDFDESASTSKKKKRVETHEAGQRVRYFPDDDNHSLKEMFENEKFSSVADQNLDFVKMSARTSKNDDMDDIFTDRIREKESDEKAEAKAKDRAIRQHQKLNSNIERCKLCIQSDSMSKHLMVSLGETVILTIPSHEALTEGHCLLSPVRHVSCSTLLDENEWSELLEFRRALCTLFRSRDEDVIFFETARYFDKYPHMTIQCVPVSKEEGDMAPIYFKKAIDECEMEWAQNKKLVSLKGRDVRKAIPKGLPYFFVSFGMEEGFAHVLEDEKYFPDNFAQEIIGGMMDLHHSKWRKPKTENFEAQSKRALQLSQLWGPFDCTNK